MTRLKLYIHHRISELGGTLEITQNNDFLIFKQENPFYKYYAQVKKIVLFLKQKRET